MLIHVHHLLFKCYFIPSNIYSCMSCTHFRSLFLLPLPLLLLCCFSYSFSLNFRFIMSFSPFHHYSINVCQYILASMHQSSLVFRISSIDCQILSYWSTDISSILLFRSSTFFLSSMFPRTQSTALH